MSSLGKLHKNTRILTFSSRTSFVLFVLKSIYSVLVPLLDTEDPEEKCFLILLVQRPTPLDQKIFVIGHENIHHK